MSAGDPQASDRDYEPSRASAKPADAVRVRPGSQRFTRWDACAAIRTKPRQSLRPLPATQAEPAFFSPDLVPLAAHALVRARGHARAVTLQHLYRYLQFTIVLEQQHVNPVLVRIADRGYGLDLPASMRIDAYRIYCDEGYHALCAADLVQQLVERTGVAPLCDDQPAAFRALAALLAAAPAAQRPWLELGFVLVSETLVSAILARAHADERVEPAVRQVILEHAQDEAVHSAYFQDLARYGWPKLPEEMRRAIGCALPRLILSFLGPDREHLGLVLAALGYTAAECALILDETLPADHGLAAARAACTTTLALFRGLGAFADPLAAVALRDSRLLDGAA